MALVCQDVLVFADEVHVVYAQPPSMMQLNKSHTKDKEKKQSVQPLVKKPRHVSQLIRLIIRLLLS